ncbi:MAG: DUF6164 family protein [Methylobacter sp.]|jgi:hypothetical protein
MSILLFSLRGVPEDEADEIRELLIANELDYYETSAGNWSASMPAIWLKQNEDLDRARQLLNEYHQQRMMAQREKYQQLKKEGKNISIIHSIKNNPLRFISYVAAILFILYVSIRMVLEFGW